MKRKLLWGVLLALLAATAVMVLGIIGPVYFADREIGIDGPLVLEQEAQDSWRLSWPAAEGADRYRVEMELAGQAEGKLILRDYVDGATELSLPALPAEEALTIRVTPAVRFRTLLGEDHHYSQQSLQATTILGQRTLPVVDFAVDGDEKTLRMHADCPLWQYRLTDGNGAVLSEATVDRQELVLTFGGEAGIPIPADGQGYTLSARSRQETKDLVILGLNADGFSVTGQSLRDRQLEPELTVPAKNTVRLTWQQTKGEGYQVQRLTQEGWTAVYTTGKDGSRSYEDWIAPEQTCQYRVLALDGQGQSLQVSEELSYTGQPLVRYATVWPVMELAVYAGPDRGSVLTTVPTGCALCVLDEINGMFAVNVDGRTGYINSSYCMINLPEYLGGLCAYNITNSVYSIYAIHDFPIADVTGVVTTGYEDVYQSDGSYLAPLLYPAAKKLYNAACDAWEQGLRLKIYDSFRPHKATLEIYELTSLVMNDPVPEATYYGTARETVALPEPRPGWDYLSLGWLMTGPNFAQNSFLARGGSAHNLGIALDLTLENRADGQELRMQSAMHDLSRYSVLSENNDNAALLARIMHGAGFGGLISEWWHFQDDVSKSALNLPYVSEGISAEGWIRDDIGWKYRTAKGGCLSDGTAEIDGVDYTFDEAGYTTR